MHFPFEDVNFELLYQFYCSTNDCRNGEGEAELLLQFLLSDGLFRSLYWTRCSCGVYCWRTIEKISISFTMSRKMAVLNASSQTPLLSSDTQVTLKCDRSFLLVISR